LKQDWIKQGTCEDASAAFSEHGQTPGRYVALLRGERCQTYEGFFSECAAALQFPNYFGNNWNAWDECINDLDWLEFTSLAIVIDCFELLFSKEGHLARDRYLLEQSFNEWARYWQEEKGVTCFVVAFSEEKLVLPRYALPERLNGHFRITDVKTKSDTVLSGYLECCGDRAFEVFYDAKFKRSWIGEYSLYATERGFALLARCARCGGEIRLLNCRSEEELTSAIPHQLFCPKCGKNEFALKVSLEYPSDAAEQEETNERGEAFGWIWVAASCCACGKELKHLVVLEND
jgi:hypothetical protein